MKVLVINCGSSSLKYQLFDMANEQRLARGLIERIGEKASQASHWTDSRKIDQRVRISDHDAAFEILRANLLSPDFGSIASPDEIHAIGHRVVHGGETFVDSTLIDERVIDTIIECSSLAPLHNPPNLAGIRAAQKLFPSAVHVAVFDTAFHRDLPPHAYHYAIPYDYYQRLHVRKYGFHGTSHRFVALRAAEMLGIHRDQLNAITCHLGNGCSMAAIHHGKSIDTTLGLTPLEGLVMGTRSGDIDPGVIFHLAAQDRLTIRQLDDLLNKKSGLLGLSGVSNDMRTVCEAADAGNDRARLALDVFCYRIRKYIGAYLAVLGTAHAVVFTGGIGENAPIVRQKSTVGLESLGILFDAALNAAATGREATFSAPESRIKLLVIPTNEELLIARDTRDIASKMCP
jgi:acetate kinase